MDSTVGKVATTMGLVGVAVWVVLSLVNAAAEKNAAAGRREEAYASAWPADRIERYASSEQLLRDLRGIASLCDSARGHFDDDCRAYRRALRAVENRALEFRAAALQP